MLLKIIIIKSYFTSFCLFDVKRLKKDCIRLGTSSNNRTPARAAGKVVGAVSFLATSGR